LISTLGYTLDAAHEVLEMGETVLRFAPFPGLAEAAHVLLSIWDAVQLVEVSNLGSPVDASLLTHFIKTNRLACLRLTERCADMLLGVREEIFEAGDQVSEELTVPLRKLTE
jgi:abelson tyrosine-protein kinase 1